MKGFCTGTQLRGISTTCRLKSLQRVFTFGVINSSVLAETTVKVIDRWHFPCKTEVAKWFKCEWILNAGINGLKGEVNSTELLWCTLMRTFKLPLQAKEEVLSFGCSFLPPVPWYFGPSVWVGDYWTKLGNYFDGKTAQLKNLTSSVLTFTNACDNVVH